MGSEAGALVQIGSRANGETLNVCLEPEYLARFQCIASRCEDTCCAGWSDIALDEDTADLYRTISHPPLAADLQGNVKWMESPAGGDAASITMDHTGRCPFLDTDRLCSIQRALGAEALCATCGLYPRISRFESGAIERSGTLSCPELARLALLNPEPITFTITAPPGTRWDARWREIQEQHGSLAPEWDQIRRIRKLVIDLLQDRTFTICHRLVLVGLLCSRVQQALDTYAPHRISEIALEFEQALRSTVVADTLSLVPPLLDVHVGFMLNSLTNWIERHQLRGRYAQCYSEMCAGLELSADTPAVDVVARYKRAYRRFYAPFLRRHGYMLENYLVHQSFKNRVPFGGANCFEEYAAFVLYYALIQINLVGVSAYHRGMTPELVVFVIQSFTKSFEHSSVFMPTALASLRENNLLDIANMSSFIQAQ